MALEQEKPDKPNFKLIGLLVIIAIPVIFIVAWIIVRAGGGHMVPAPPKSPHPTSMLVLPGTSSGGSASSVALG